MPAFGIPHIILNYFLVTIIDTLKAIFDNTINIDGKTNEYYSNSERKNVAKLIMEHPYLSSSNHFKSSREELFVDVSNSTVPTGLLYEIHFNRIITPY